MAEAVKSAKDADTALERCADLYESAQHASDLANKLISFERANKAGNANLHEALNLVDVVRSAIDTVQRRVPASVQVLFNSEEPVIQVSGDLLMLEEGFANLLDNALKHAGAALTTIVIDIISSDGVARIEVSDDGVGLKDEDMSKAMERFGQINPGGGSGLGLSIVQMVANAHGGRFTLEKPCRGLRAVFVLPTISAL